MGQRSVAYLLIGGGLAAASCAEELRERGADGEILLAGRERDLPYNRPPLTKEYFRGEQSRDEILVHPAEWYEAQGIEALTGVNVTALDPGERRATLSDGDEVCFEQALIATGSNVRLLHPPGAELDGIHYLRTIHNCDAIGQELEAAERVVLIGGSYIGTELAASLTAMGKRCELIMIEAVTFERFYGPEVGGFFGRVLGDHGVKIHGGQELERFEGDGDRVGRVVTKSGTAVECDFVVIGAGVHPEIKLAERAGLDTASGIVCDRRLQTSAPGIFAAGDVAEYDSVVHGRRLRVEHWDVAFNQGKAVAGNMLGAERDYDVVPYFWSDLADWAGMEYVGPAAEWDEVWLRGGIDEGAFSAWYVKDNQIAAALGVERSDDLDTARRLLAEGTSVADKRALIEDLDTDLGEAFPASRG